MAASWFETRGVAALLTMRIWILVAASWFETRRVAALLSGASR
jgi:hypothetical protein